MNNAVDDIAIRSGHATAVIPIVAVPIDFTILQGAIVHIDTCAIAAAGSYDGVVTDDAVPQRGKFTEICTSTIRVVCSEASVLDDEAVPDNRHSLGKIIRLIQDTLHPLSIEGGTVSFGAFVERGLRSGEAAIDAHARHHAESIAACQAVADVSAFGHPNGRLGLHEIGHGECQRKVICGIGPRGTVLVACTTHFHINNVVLVRGNAGRDGIR